MSGKFWFPASAVFVTTAALLQVALVPTPARTQGADPREQEQDRDTVAGPGGRGVTGFTGFTRPGYPDDVINREGKVVPAGYERVGTWVVGGTVYFTVLERKGTAGRDAFGTGVNDFNHSFVRGVDERGEESPDFDTSARYLYLYQTVNDRTLGNAAATEKDVVPVTGTTVRLIVDPSRITSWGHFTGIGFQAHFKAAGKEPVQGAAAVKDEGDVVLPVSAVSLLVPKKQTASTRMYRQDSPAYRSAKPLSLARIVADAEAKAVKESGVAPAADGVLKRALDATHDPNRVVLLRATTAARRRAIWPFGDGPGGASRGPGPRERDGAQAREDDAAGGAKDGEDRASGQEEVMASGAKKHVTRGGVRAVWGSHRPLAPFARGSVFGFTSDLPPVFDGVYLRPLRARRGSARSPIIPAATDGVAAAAAAGVVPSLGAVPTPFEQAGEETVPVIAEDGGAPMVFGPGTFGPIGGLGPVGGYGGYGGLGAMGPGTGFVPAAAAIGGGTGGGPGSGSSTGTSPLTTPQQQQQQQQQQQPSLAQTVAVNVNASAKAGARARAEASSTGHCCDAGGDIVPAPPALFLAGMGLPTLWLLARRRKAD